MSLRASALPRTIGVSACAILLAGSAAPSASRADRQAGGHAAEIERWRQQRETRLKADDGWLSVAGLFWLEEGPNRCGSAPDSPVRLPEGAAPAQVGVFEHHAGRTTLRLDAGVAAQLNGAPLAAGGSVELRPDTSDAPDVVRLGRLSLVVIERGGRFAVRLRDPENPRRRAFRGLEWYPVRDAYRVTARFVPYDPPRRLPVPNVVGQVNEMPSPGRVEFTVNGQAQSLDAVLESESADELFFIFRDATTGKETYPAGRFLYAPLPQDGRVVLDFNKAYSPPCAFTPYATCPLPPKQNRLSTAIEAGEKHRAH